MGQALDTDGATDAETAAADVGAPARPAHRPTFGFEHRNGIDSKSRVVLPSVYRGDFADGGRLTLLNGRCLAAFPPDEFVRWESHVRTSLASSAEPDPADILRELYRNTTDIKLDIQGRMVVPEVLRAIVGIGDEVRFVGCGSRVELWPADESDERAEERADHRATIAMLSTSFDIPGFEA